MATGPCAEGQLFLLLLANGVKSPSARKAFAIHAASCERCRATATAAVAQSRRDGATAPAVAAPAPRERVALAVGADEPRLAIRFHSDAGRVVIDAGERPLPAPIPTLRGADVEPPKRATASVRTPPSAVGDPARTPTRRRGERAVPAPPPPPPRDRRPNALMLGAVVVVTAATCFTAGGLLHGTGGGTPHMVSPAQADDSTLPTAAHATPTAVRERSSERAAEPKPKAKRERPKRTKRSPEPTKRPATTTPVATSQPVKRQPQAQAPTPKPSAPAPQRTSTKQSTPTAAPPTVPRGFDPSSLSGADVRALAELVLNSPKAKANRDDDADD